MQKFLRSIFHKEIGGLHEAAYLVAFASFASQILGLVRDRLLAHTFGAGMELDIYYAAFRVPDLLYATLASLVAVSVLIPFLVEWIGPSSSQDSRRAQIFLSSIMTVFVSGMALLVAVGCFFAPKLAGIVSPGFSLENQEVLAGLMRILMLSPFLLGISNILAGVTQALNRFYVYALSPLVYNLGIIFGIVFLYPLFGLNGLGLGVVIGAFLHLAVQLPLLKIAGLSFAATSAINWKDVRQVVRVSVPRTVALSLSQVSFVVLTVFASYMPQGSISIMNFAFAIQAIPFSLIGVSYSVAAFPALSRLWKNDEREKFAHQITVALRHIVFLTLPVTALFFVFRREIVELILGSGRFSTDDVLLTSASMAIVVVSILGQSVVSLLTRAYYATGNTARPLSVNVIASLGALLFVLPLLSLFKTNQAFARFWESAFGIAGIGGTLVLMLPLAYALGSILNALVLWRVFGRDFKISWVSVWQTFAESLLGALALGVVGYGVLPVFKQLIPPDTFLALLLSTSLASLCGILCALGLLLALRSRELSELISQARRRLLGQSA